jgi:hypothetical protein
MLESAGVGANDRELSKEILLLKKRLKAIWRERPAATDTADEISRKWLGQLDTRTVLEALHGLVDEGLVQKWCSGGHTFFYASDPKVLKMQ